MPGTLVAACLPYTGKPSWRTLAPTVASQVPHHPEACCGWTRSLSTCCGSLAGAATGPSKFRRPQSAACHSGKIVQLTGITNELVRDEPLFAEVADAIAVHCRRHFRRPQRQLRYGFIAFDFERVGRRFRFPKLCTCAGMRRRYPGHKSYGLGKLCEIYGISLANYIAPYAMRRPRRSC